MTDPRSERRVQLGGRRRVIRYDFNALCDLEETLGVSGVEALNVKLSEFGFGTIRAFTWAGLLHEEPDVTVREVGVWLSALGAKGLEQIGQAVGHALAAAFPDAEDMQSRDRGEADPTTGTGDGPSSGPLSDPA